MCLELTFSLSNVPSTIRYMYAITIAAGIGDLAGMSLIFSVVDKAAPVI